MKIKKLVCIFVAVNLNKSNFINFLKLFIMKKITLFKKMLLAAVMLVGSVSAWGQEYWISTNFSDWTTTGTSYVAYADAVSGISFNEAIVRTGVASSTTAGACSGVAYVQQRAASVMTFPEYAGVGRVTFCMSAGAANRSVKLYNGTTLLETFTGIGTAGASFYYDVNSSENVNLVLKEASNPIYIIDMSIEKFGGAGEPEDPEDPFLIDDFEGANIGWVPEQYEMDIRDNDYPGGINTSAKVLFANRTGGNDWAGTILPAAAFTTAFEGPITGYQYLKAKMYRNNTNVPNLKINDGCGGDILPMAGITIVADEWQDVVFDIGTCAVNFVMFMVDRTEVAWMLVDDVILSNDPTPRTYEEEPPQPETPIVKWEFASCPGGTGNFGDSPFAPASSDANLTVGNLTRHWTLLTTGSGAQYAWGGNNFTAANFDAAVTANEYVTFTLTANAGYTLSLSSIGEYNIRRSNSGPSTGQWQYAIGTDAFVNIGGDITWGAVTTNVGNPQEAIDLSAISALQDVAAGSTVTFRLAVWGATGTGGTFYFNDSPSTPEVLGLSVYGVIADGGLSIANAPADNGSIISTTFFNLLGAQIAEPIAGQVCIKKVIFENGAVETSKVIKK